MCSPVPQPTVSSQVGSQMLFQSPLIPGTLPDSELSIRNTGEAHFILKLGSHSTQLAVPASCCDPCESITHQSPTRLTAEIWRCFSPKELWCCGCQDLALPSQGSEVFYIQHWGQCSVGGCWVFLQCFIAVSQNSFQFPSCEFTVSLHVAPCRPAVCTTHAAPQATCKSCHAHRILRFQELCLWQEGTSCEHRSSKTLIVHKLCKQTNLVLAYKSEALGVYKVLQLPAFSQHPKLVLFS